MEKSPEYFGFTPIENFFAYHCFGDKATEILSSIDQPYKDITHWSMDDLRSMRSKHCAAIFVFTDDAEVYASEIDAFIKQYEDVDTNFFILDLHASSQYKIFKEKWEFYNILATRYCTLQDNILHFLLFFKHFIETMGLISMDYPHDFRSFMRTATFIAAGKAGAAGVLYGHSLANVKAAAFDYNMSIEILIIVVLGGMGSVPGSIIAAIVLTVLTVALREFSDYRMVV